MAKTNKKWVLLCSTAVAAVYATGYFATDTQASIVQPTAYTQSSIQSTTTQTQGTLTVATQTSSLYTDGTYIGTGNTRRGSIEVTVTIKSDKITDVEISNFAMHYSERDVEGMPAEVIQKQSAQVSNVSGATYSTEAFQDAVQEALSQAENA